MFLYVDRFSRNLAETDKTFWFFGIENREMDFLKFFQYNGILLHSGLNPAWHFWLSTRFSCCLKMKSVENISGYIREQFYRFSRGCKPRENLWNCSRKYPKIFENVFIFRQQKIEFKPMLGMLMLSYNRIFCCIWSRNYSIVQL